MIGPTEIIILAVICLVPLGIIFGTLGIVKLARRSDSTSQGNSELAVASLVLGIISLLAWLLPILGIPVAVVGLVFGVIEQELIKAPDGDSGNGDVGNWVAGSRGESRCVVIPAI